MCIFHVYTALLFFIAYIAEWKKIIYSLSWLLTSPMLSRWTINISVPPLVVGELCSSKQFINKAANTLEIILLGASATVGIIFNYLNISHTADRKKAILLEMNRLTKLPENFTSELNHLLPAWRDFPIWSFYNKQNKICDSSPHIK